MSRLFRGRKLLAAALREFAMSHGYVRAGKPADASPGPADDQTIDLEKYRASRGAARGDS
jgi:hypothetical protein